MPENTGKKQENTRFSKGRSGNPNGRPKGTRNKKSAILAQLFLERDLEETCNRVVEETKAGSMQAAKMILDRILPPKKDSPITIDIPEIKTASDILQAFNGFFKGLVDSIPFVGSPIVGAWDGYWGSLFEETVEYLATAVIKLGEEKIDKQYIESEEYLDLFTLALRTRMQSRSQQKAKFILGMLLESMQKIRDERFSLPF
jgi:hypothetical protein